jgi:hypothetical protein
MNSVLKFNYGYMHNAFGDSSLLAIAKGNAADIPETADELSRLATPKSFHCNIELALI